MQLLSLSTWEGIADWSMTFAVQARVAGVEDRLLWLDGFQSAEALSELLLCGAAFVAPFDEQSPTSVS